MRLSALGALLAAAGVARAAYWLEEIAHQGVASFNPDKSYQVFRNVKTFGAKGDGVTDDTDAINRAISDGGRCAGGDTCAGTTITPATVYFPAGTYLVSDSIVPYFYTQLVGDPTSLPVLKGASSFRGALAIVDGDPYADSGLLTFTPVNTFFRQVRNFVIDTTAVRAPVSGLHWPTAQATSVQNVVFNLAPGADAGHVGLFIENGSGGLCSDLVFNGGKTGAQFGNQQFTMRNLTFNGCDTAIQQLWNWGWTYRDLHVNSCRVGINMSADATASVSIIDSIFSDVRVGIVNERKLATTAVGANSLTMENVRFDNVGTVVQAEAAAVSIPGSGAVVDEESYLRGHVYSPQGPVDAAGADSKYDGRPTVLLENGAYLSRAKPQYQTTPSSLVLSARSYGARGDGVTDDTAALNSLFRAASAQFAGGAIAYLDAGYYLVTDTVYIPPNIRITGEALAATIMASGAKFSNMSRPHPVVMVGRPAEQGYVEWSDTIVSGQGATAGAVYIQYNLDTPAPASGSVEPNQPSGLWDVHVRAGGARGDDLGPDTCPTTPHRDGYANPDCICGYLSMHLTNTSHNLYVENNWLWTSDHSIDDLNATQISVFNGRGLHIASTKGRIWLSGTSVEHHTLYQYSLANTRDIFMGQIQTESPYYQPNPPAPYPFTTPDQSLYDPPFAIDCAADGGSSGGGSSSTSSSSSTTSSAPSSGSTGTGSSLSSYQVERGLVSRQEAANSTACFMAWGLVILGSQNVRVAGAGLYSFFNNYSDDCAQAASGDWRCQKRIFHIGATPDLPNYTPAQGIVPVQDVVVYGLNTVGTKIMVHREDEDVADFQDNKCQFSAAIAQFRY